MYEIEQLLAAYFPEGLPPSPTVEERVAVAVSLEKETHNAQEGLQ